MTLSMPDLANSLLSNAYPNRVAPPPAAAHIKPYSYCVLDLETRNCDAKTIDRVVAKKMAEWEPPANYKDPIKIGALREEVRAKAGDKSATWDEAPIATIGIKSDVEFRLLHTLRTEPPRLVGGATVQGFAGEAEMLRAFHSLIGVAWILPAPEIEPTHLFGHAILGFDLPKLRLRSLVNHLRLPAALVEELPVFDSMRRWCRFSRNQQPFVPMSEIIEALGLPQHKGVVDGAMVPNLIESGQFEEVIRYAMLDLISTENICLMMQGKL